MLRDFPFFCLVAASIALAPGGVHAEDEGDDIEFMGDESEPAGETAEGEKTGAPGAGEDLPEGANFNPLDDEQPLSLPDATFLDDQTAPSIEDLAIAAMSMNSAPMVTAVLTDDLSGVEKASVFVRTNRDQDYQSVALYAGAGGLFVARLPLGLQRTGFDYYVEVTDAAGNGPTRVGSAEQPLRINPTNVSAVARFHDRDRVSKEPIIHPVWMIATLAVGVVGAVASSYFWYDMAAVLPQQRTQSDQDLLNGLITAENYDLEQKSIDDAQVADLTGGIALAVLGGGLIAVSGALFVISLEE